MRFRSLRAIYPGWWLAIGTSLSLGLVAGMSFWAFGLFVDPLQAEFGWSGSVLGGAVSLSLLVSGLASPLVGRLVDRYQPRRVILIGSAATVLGYLLLAGVRELWQFLALMAFLAFFRAWIFYVPFTTLITRWFSRRRATAMGIATSGFGVGGLVFLPFMSELLSIAGWRAAFGIAALLVLVVNGLFVLFARNDPPQAMAARELANPTPVGTTDPLALLLVADPRRRSERAACRRCAPVCAGYPRPLGQPSEREDVAAACADRGAGRLPSVG